MDHHDGDEDDDLFTSRPTPSSSREPPKTPTSSILRPASRDGAYHSLGDSTNSDEAAARDAALRHELDSLRRMNAAVVAVSDSLDKAKANMATISQTVTHATALLDTWTRILSQTEQNQRLILNPGWEGASKDLADAQKEVLRRKREKERREAEEVQRRQAAEARRRQQEEEQRRRAEAAAATPSSRGRRGVAPGARGTRGISRGGGGGGGAAAASSAADRSTVSTTSSAAGTTTSSSATTTTARGTGRAATAGYGRLGAVGTKNAARGRGRGVG